MYINDCSMLIHLLLSVSWMYFLCISPVKVRKVWKSESLKVCVSWMYLVCILPAKVCNSEWQSLSFSSYNHPGGWLSAYNPKLLLTHQLRALLNFYYLQPLRGWILEKPFAGMDSRKRWDFAKPDFTEHAGTGDAAKGISDPCIRLSLYIFRKMSNYLPHLAFISENYITIVPEICDRKKRLNSTIFGSFPKMNKASEAKFIIWGNK